MSKMLNARIDSETAALLEELKGYWGNNTSQIVREALRALACVTPQKASQRITHVGVVDSGITDLASNKKHLKEFGK